MKWKKLNIPGVPTEINEHGIVREKINVLNGLVVHNRIVPITKIGNGHWGFTRTVDGELHHFAIHRLLAMAFISNPKKHSYVIFKDKNPNNYKDLNNLKWHPYPNTGYKLTPKDVQLIKTGLRLNPPIPVTQLAEEFHVSVSLIRKIKRGERWA